MTITPVMDPGGFATEVFFTVLSDADYGFNAVLAAIASQFGITPFNINFGTDPTVKTINFALGSVDPQMLTDNSVGVNFPCMIMFAGKSVNHNKNKGQLFSGTVHVIVDLYIDFPASRGDQDFETLSSAVKAAMLLTTNSVYAQSLIPSNACYNGGVEVLPMPVVKGGRNWLRTLRHVYLLDVDVPFPTIT